MWLMALAVYSIVLHFACATCLEQQTPELCYYDVPFGTTFVPGLFVRCDGKGEIDTSWGVTIAPGTYAPVYFVDLPGCQARGDAAMTQVPVGGLSYAVDGYTCIPH